MATSLSASRGKVPLYRSIATQIEQRIIAGTYAPETLLPSENDLALEFHVTRMTVRHALQELARQGLIDRRQGYGTVVRPRRFERYIDDSLSLTQELVARGF